MQKFRPTPFTVAFGPSAAAVRLVEEEDEQLVEEQVQTSSNVKSTVFEQIYVESESEPEHDFYAKQPMKQKEYTNNCNVVLHSQVVSLLQWIILLQIVLILLVIYRIV